MGADLILWDDWSISLSEQKAWTYLRGMEIQLLSDSGPAEGEECKDLKEMGHHFLPGCVCRWWVVDQTPTCCPWSPGPYCRKLQLCCGPTICHQRNVLLNDTIAEWLSIPTITSLSIFVSCSVFQRWNVVPVFDNGQQWFNIDKCLGVLLFWGITESFASGIVSLWRSLRQRAGKQQSTSAI